MGLIDKNFHLLEVNIDCLLADTSLPCYKLVVIQPETDLLLPLKVGGHSELVCPWQPD